MNISEPRLRSLLRQAQKVAESGKRSAAEKLYRQIVEEAPESEAAWLGLAEVVTDDEEKTQAYRQVLSLAPDNQEAQVGLSQIGDNEVSVQETPDDQADPFNQSRAWLDAATKPVKDKQTAVEEPDPGLFSEKITFHTHQHEDEIDSSGEEQFDLVCYRHPNRETSLRCYSCDRPICSDCAVKTPVGYRCPTCIREAEEVFFNAKITDYIIAPLVSLPLSLVAGFLVLYFVRGFFFILLMLFIGGAVGSFIGRLAKRAVGRRRGRYLPHLVATSIALGVIIPAFPILLALLFGNFGVISALLIPGIYLFVATGSAFYQMK